MRPDNGKPAVDNMYQEIHGFIMIMWSILPMWSHMPEGVVDLVSEEIIKARKSTGG